MLLHKKCKSELYIDLSKNYKIVARFSLTTKGVKVGNGDVKPSGKTEATFWCPQCDSCVEQTDILGLCDCCGKNFEVSEMVKISGSGGIYCLTCANQYYQNDGKTRLELIVKKIIE